jgi:putative endonuclease
MSKGMVYILQDETSRYYIGSTSDLARKLKQHSQGQTPTTHRFKNPKLVFSQEYPTLPDARKVELKLKRLKRKDYIANIIQDGFIKIKS